MSTLTGNKISLTYKSLFKTADNDVLTAALKQMSDGLGNNSVSNGVTSEYFAIEVFNSRSYGNLNLEFYKLHLQ